MSKHSSLALILAAVEQEHVSAILAQSLANLIDAYQFGFRGIGGVMRLVCDRRGYKWQETIPDSFSSAEEINADGIGKLLSRHGALDIAGSIRLPNEERLYDLDLIAYPAR